MSFLIRLLKLLLVLFLIAAVVAWFAARRGDRGYIEEEVTINRPAPTVFRWITSEDLLRRWISDVVKLQRVDSSRSVEPANAVFRIDEFIGGRRVALDAKIMRTVPNQDVQIEIRPTNRGADDFSSNVEFKLLSNGDYTRLVFSSQTEFRSISDRIFEPVFTFATARKISEDLSRLKLKMEADATTQSPMPGRDLKREAPPRVGGVTNAR
jgi:uncharacterized protein YndB with AHSA1/START domain